MISFESRFEKGDVGFPSFTSQLNKIAGLLVI